MLPKESETGKTEISVVDISNSGVSHTSGISKEEISLLEEMIEDMEREEFLKKGNIINKTENSNFVAQWFVVQNDKTQISKPKNSTKSSGEKISDNFDKAGFGNSQRLQISVMVILISFFGFV